MRTIRIAIVLVGLTLPALAHAADPFAEFRIPAHWARSANGSFGLSGSQSRQGVPLDAIRTYQLGGDGSLGFHQLRDSEALRWEADVSFVASLSAQHVNEHSVPLLGYTRDRARAQRLYDEDWHVASGVQLYPWTAPVGFGLAGWAVGKYTQQEAQDDLLDVIPTTPVINSQTSDHAAIHGYDTAGYLTASIGYGRVRDATVVYAVHVLEERLRESGALTRPLSAAARERLAALEYVAPDLADVHDRPDRFTWREVEHILREDGALSERGLDAYSVVRGRESVFGFVQRPTGFFVGPAVTATTEHTVTRQEIQSTRMVDQGGTTLLYSNDATSLRRVGSSDAFWVGGTAEIHRPVGWAWQLDAAADVNTPARSGERGLIALASADAQWMIADRWAITGTASYVRNYFSPRGSDGVLSYDVWQAAYGVRLGYFLEDHVQLTASVGEVQQRTHDSTFTVESYQRSGQFKLGLTYRFFGRFEAPGILEGVRPMY